MVAQPGRRVPAGVAHDADRADHGAGTVAHGHRHRDQPRLDELVVLGPRRVRIEQRQPGRAAIDRQHVAHAEADRHGPPPGDLHDETHPVAVPHGQRHGLVQLLGQPHGRRGEGVAQPVAGQVRLAQLHQARREPHVAAVRAQVAEVDERAHDPVDRGPGQAGRAGQVRRAGGPRRVGGHGAQHGQPALQRPRGFRGPLRRLLHGFLRRFRVAETFRDDL